MGHELCDKIFKKKQVWNVSNISQLDTYNTYRYHIRFTSERPRERLKYRNQTKYTE